MIPTNTLRERMTEALKRYSGASDYCETPMNSTLRAMVQAAIEAIGDPVLIKTADSLEPTFVLRAQDKAAFHALAEWCARAKKNGCDDVKILDAHDHLDMFGGWPTRKWPD